MRKMLVISVLCLGVASCATFLHPKSAATDSSLRALYSKHPSQWPAPDVDPQVAWTELGVLPAGPIKGDSLSSMIDLGKALFFDTRLSGSGKISCATCHQPELNWTDGKERSIGHEGALNKRNSPTIQNTWFYNRLFWDGRSKDLQDQAFAPINSETEMHSEMPEVLGKLRGTAGYALLFKKVFGDGFITPDRFTEAIAVFEKTIVSRKSAFDFFLEGDTGALSDQALQGLHIFRTKARCMNCHHGPLFSDNSFHANGFFPLATDKGYYLVSKVEKDTGIFKTPSLRDVTMTGPWMHDGSQHSLEAILGTYSAGGLAKRDPLVRPVNLDQREIAALLAFLQAISAPAPVFTKPVLPD